MHRIRHEHKHVSKHPKITRYWTLKSSLFGQYFFLLLLSHFLYPNRSFSFSLPISGLFHSQSLLPRRYSSTFRFDFLFSYGLHGVYRLRFERTILAVFNVSAFSMYVHGRVSMYVFLSILLNSTTNSPAFLIYFFLFRRWLIPERVFSVGEIFGLIPEAVRLVRYVSLNIYFHAVRFRWKVSSQFIGNFFRMTFGLTESFFFESRRDAEGWCIY